MSEPYIVSARKYRPQTFDSVVGQQHITDTLKNAIRNQHLAHAYLFCGPRGVGKTTCARILARTINCEQPTEAIEACGQCSTCKSFEENTSLNIFELDAASNNSVEDIRRLNEQVRYAPQHGKYKIYIIDEVHMLSSSAFNAFLKTLEEPPAYAIFILATTEKHKILPTILSRCQIFDFRRIQTEDIVRHLAGICKKEHQEAEEAALHVIAQKSEGCMRDALSMMDRIAGFSEGQLRYESVIEHLNILDASVYFKFVEQLLVKDLSAALLYLDEIYQKGFEGDLILSGFSEHFRNLLLSRDGTLTRLIDLPAELKQTYFQHARIAGQSYLISALSVLNDAELKYRTALNKRMHVEMTLIRLCYLNDWLEPGGDPSEPAGPAEKKKQRPEGAALTPAGVGRAAMAPATTGSATTESVATASAIAEKGPAGSHQEHSVSNPDRSAEMPDGSGIKAAEEMPPSREVSGVMPPISAPSGDAGPFETAGTSSVPTSVAVPEARMDSAPAGAGQKRPVTKGRLSRNMLSQIRAEQKSEDRPEKIQFSQDLANTYFEEYLPVLRQRNIPAAEQLRLLELSCLNAETLELTCHTGIQFTYAAAVKEDLADFCRMKSHNPDVKVVIRQDAAPQDAAAVESPILSKLEIYERMAEKNPALQLLKDKLGLSVEF